MLIQFAEKCLPAASEDIECELAFLGTDEQQTAAQFARAVQEERADAGEPYLSIIMVPGLGNAKAR